MLPSKFRCKLLFLSQFAWMLFRSLLLLVLFIILLFTVLAVVSTVIHLTNIIGIPGFVIVIFLFIAISIYYDDLKKHTVWIWETIWETPPFDLHKWGDWEYEEGSCTQVVKCLICGVKKAREERVVHDWVWKYEREGSCHTIEHCSKCAEEQRGVRHDWGERKYTSVCEFTQQCLRCGEIKNDDEHEWYEDIEYWEGDSWRVSRCSKCGL